MCRLWYSAVWKYLRRYDYVLRFDEDNILVHGQWLEDITYFGTVKCVPQDSADVTVGLTEFFWNSERRHYEKYYPYTNVMFVNVQWALTDITVQNMFRAVEDSNCICINRWGDLPLWGETLQDLVYDHEFYTAGVMCIRAMGMTCFTRSPTRVSSR